MCRWINCCQAIIYWTEEQITAMVFTEGIVLEKSSAKSDPYCINLSDLSYQTDKKYDRITVLYTYIYIW